MIEVNVTSDKNKNYKYIVSICRDMLLTEKSTSANLSNITAVINELMDGLNWVGFYIIEDGELVLNTFQGKVACTRIAIGKGVCGTAVATREVQLVEDVHKFPGHIACDGDTNSELVVPIIVNGDVYGVLDIDSPIINRFTEIERDCIVEVVKLIEEFLENKKQ